MDLKKINLEEIYEILSGSKYPILKLSIYIEIDSNDSIIEYLVNSKTKLYVNILKMKECVIKKYVIHKDIKLLRKELSITIQYNISSEVKNNGSRSIK
ncbi:MAG: hypothetical protein PHY59_05615 [Methanobacterium sp.]|nr:hypothetical protein [Methanobacterium sp.]